jgi:hypothetical protein
VPQQSFTSRPYRTLVIPGNSRQQDIFHQPVIVPFWTRSIKSPICSTETGFCANVYDRADNWPNSPCVILQDGRPAVQYNYMPQMTTRGSPVDHSLRVSALRDRIEIKNRTPSNCSIQTDFTACIYCHQNISISIR